LPSKGDGFARLRRDERHFGTPRLIAAIEHAASVVAKERPGSVLVVGDLSVDHGGRLLPHLSHRTGRDADLLLYVSTPEGAMVTSPGFVHFGADGLAWDPKGQRYLRFDVAREWLLVKTLVEDDDARVQWIFLNHALEPMLIEWARAKGEPLETIHRAEEVLLEPKPGGVHDDHTHIRVACDDAEVALGCEPNGPDRAWFVKDDPAPEAAPSTDDLVREVSEPLAELTSGKAP
jgi:penicillin-insensitive murein DD-endopeptidase